jgi:type II secretory pathway pseudopilin PulG
MRRLVLLLLVVPLAACGGSGRLSKQAYEQQLQAVGRQAQRASDSVNNAGSTRAAVAKHLLGAHEAMQSATDTLQGMKPPADADADTKTIVVALQYLSDEIAKLQKAYAKNDQAAATNVSTEIQRSKQIAAGVKAAADLKKKGYAVGVLGQ